MYSQLTVAKQIFCNRQICKESCNNLKLGWLPIKERRNQNLLKSAFKVINDNSWPTHLTLEEKKLILFYQAELNH